MAPASPADRVRQALNVLLAVGQIAASFIPALTGYGWPIGEGEPEVTANPAVPPGPAFAIWGLLFPAVLAYAVYQAAPQRATDPLLRPTGWLPVAALALTVVWVSGFQLAGIPAVADAGFSAAVLACYLAALARVGNGSWLWWFVPIPVALMAGWLTVALWVNLAAALVSTGLPGVPVACVVPVGAGFASVSVPWLFGGGLWFVGPVAWGLGWVGAGNLAAGGSLVVAVVAGATALLVVTAVALPGSARGMPGETRDGRTPGVRRQHPDPRSRPLVAVRPLRGRHAGGIRRDGPERGRSAAAGGVAMARDPRAVGGGTGPTEAAARGACAPGVYKACYLAVFVVPTLVREGWAAVPVGISVFFLVIVAL
jgi:hypothetical protein